MNALLLVVLLAATAASLAIVARGAAPALARMCAEGQHNRTLRLAIVESRAAQALGALRIQLVDAFLPTPEPAPAEPARGDGRWPARLWRGVRRVLGRTATALRAPRSRPDTLAGALLRYLTAGFIGFCGLGNALVESLLLALTYSEYLPPPEAFPPLVSTMLHSPALLLAGAVFCAVAVWGVIGLEHLGHARHPLFPGGAMAVLSLVFISLSLFLAFKAAQVRGIVGLAEIEDPDGAYALELIRAAGRTKVTVTIAVGLLTAATAAVGFLALKEWLVMTLVALFSGVAAVAVVTYRFTANAWEGMRGLPLGLCELFLRVAGREEALLSAQEAVAMAASLAGGGTPTRPRETERVG